MNLDLHHHRRKIYWMCQITGWVMFIVIELLIAYAGGNIDGRNSLLIIYLGFLGLVFTHVYRFIMKKGNWFTLEYKVISIRVFVASFAIAAIIVAALFTIVWVTHILPANARMLGLILANQFFIFLILIIWSLVYVIIHYVENFRSTEIEKLIWEAAVKDFELKTLKSQLNPHFMFNAMNSIRALIEENPPRAKEAITQLSNIFRYSLRIERVETVPLEDEIRVMEDYLALEKVRYEERLRYVVEVDNETRHIEIPPMMIQTLVENAIKHGVSKIPGGGEISITARAGAGKLAIRIENTGTLSEENVKNSQGFGISNTKQRLHLLYGTNATFNLANENGKVVVQIVIPTGVEKNDESINR